jgi:drug/metabolite transporter (DMT)-like permease
VKRSAPTPLSYSILGASQLGVGAAAIFARFALQGAPPIAVAASRLVIASLVLLAVAAWPRRGSAVLRPEVSKGHHGEHRIIFIAAGIALAIHFATWIWSLQYTSVAVSTLLVATTPIWTALYDSIVHRRHLTAIGWGAFVVGAVGLVLIVGFNATHPPIPGHALLGSALALTGAFAIGAYFILVREVRSSYGTRAIVTQTYTWSALALVIGAAAAHQSPPAFSNAQAWGGILAMAFVSQLLGHTGMNASLKWFSPSAVAMSTLLEPVIAAVLALFIFGETLTPLTLGGGLLVLLAIGGFLREEALMRRRMAAPEGTKRDGPLQA